MNLNRLGQLQQLLEEFYGAPTELNVCDFVKFCQSPDLPASLQILQDKIKGNIELTLLLDRDLFCASGKTSVNHAAILSEELSHFVYLAFNHRRQRNITHLELELQSEVDRIVLAFEGCKNLAQHSSPQELYSKLIYESYAENFPVHEEGRNLAATFLRRLSPEGPKSWTEAEITKIRSFFHKDLPEKIHMLRSLARPSP